MSLSDHRLSHKNDSPKEQIWAKSSQRPSAFRSLWTETSGSARSEFPQTLGPLGDLVRSGRRHLADQINPLPDRFNLQVHCALFSMIVPPSLAFIGQHALRLEEPDDEQRQTGYNADLSEVRGEVGLRRQRPFVYFLRVHLEKARYRAEGRGAPEARVEGNIGVRRTPGRNGRSLLSAPKKADALEGGASRGKGLSRRRGLNACNARGALL